VIERFDGPPVERALNEPDPVGAEPNRCHKHNGHRN
jgi:hypothetical protein